eukprot:scaffold9520_cov45-Attheya_sp.AAC.5
MAMAMATAADTTVDKEQKGSSAILHKCKSDHTLQSYLKKSTRYYRGPSQNQRSKKTLNY